jgi:hypothetical protein
MPLKTENFEYREALNYVNGYLRMQVLSGYPMTAAAIVIMLDKVEAEFGVKLTKDVLNTYPYPYGKQGIYNIGGPSK